MEKQLKELKELLKDEDPKNRRQAALKLGSIGNTSVIPDLLEAMWDEDGKAREYIAAALLDLGEPKAMKILLKENIKKLQSANFEERRCAAIVLGALYLRYEYDIDEVIPALIEVLNDEDDKVKENSAWALMYRGRPEGMEILIGHYKNPRPGQRRDGYLHYFEKMTSSESQYDVMVNSMNDETTGVEFGSILLRKVPSGIRSLIRGTEHEELLVRRYSFRALGLTSRDRYWYKITKHEGVEIDNIKKQVTTALIKGLEEEDDEIQSLTAEAMVNIKDEKAIPSLITILNKVKEFSPLWITTCKALTLVNVPEGVRALINGLKHPEEKSRVEIEKRLHRLFGRYEGRSETCVDVLVESLNDKDIAEKIADILKDMDVGSLDSLRKGLFNKDPIIRERCAHILSIMGRVDIQKFKKAFDIEKIPEVRATMAKALALELGGWNIPTYERIIESEEDDLIKKACEKRLKELNEFLDEEKAKFDKSGETKSYAWRIGGIGGPKARDLLIDKLLKSKDPLWAYNAAEELGKIGDKEALPALEEALEKRRYDKFKNGADRHNLETYYVRDAIKEAIKRISSDEDPGSKENE